MKRRQHGEQTAVQRVKIRKSDSVPHRELANARAVGTQCLPQTDNSAERQRTGEKAHSYTPSSRQGRGRRAYTSPEGMAGGKHFTNNNNFITNKTKAARGEKNG